MLNPSRRGGHIASTFRRRARGLDGARLLHFHRYSPVFGTSISPRFFSNFFGAHDELKLGNLRLARIDSARVLFFCCTFNRLWKADFIASYLMLR